MKSYLLLLVILVASCRQTAPTLTGVSFNALRDSFQDACRMAQWARGGEKNRIEFFKALDETDVASASFPCYRYVYSRPFGPTYVLRLEQIEDSSYRLTSKLLTSNVYSWALKIPHKKVFTGDSSQPGQSSKLLFTAQQKFSEKEWSDFAEMLAGSHYWTIEDPMPDDGILDGDNLSLYSKSIIPRNDNHALVYHENHVRPRRDTFANAFEMLLKKSTLFRRFGVVSIFDH